LLHDDGPGLRDHSFARASDYSPTDTFPNAASDPTAYATADATRYTWRASGSIQLRC